MLQQSSKSVSPVKTMSHVTWWCILHACFAATGAAYWPKCYSSQVSQSQRQGVDTLTSVHLAYTRSSSWQAGMLQQSSKLVSLAKDCKDRVS